MFWLIDHLAQLIAVLLVAVVGLWVAVLLEGWKVGKSYKELRRLRRERRRLVADLRRVRAERDHWMDRSGYWQRAYWSAARHEGDDPHPTLTLVPDLKDEDAPVS